MSKFVHNGLSTFDDGQIISDSAATSLAAAGGTSVTYTELVQNVDNYLTTNEGPDPRNAKDRNSVIFTNKYLANFYLVIGTYSAADAAAIQAGIDSGKQLYLYGRFLITTPVRLKTNTSIFCFPGTTFESSLPSSTWATSVPFICYVDLTGAGTTLAATPTLGARTVSATASVPAGTWVVIGDASLSQCGVYQVISVAGVGPYTLTLDRDVWVHFTGGDTVLVIDGAPPSNMNLDFNGATLTGTGLQAFAFLYARNSRVSNLNIIGTTFTNYNGIIFNDGCYNCSAYNCVSDGLGVAGAYSGHWMANVEQCTFDHLIARNWPAIGFRYNDTIDCNSIDCTALNNTGAQFDLTSIRGASSDTLNHHFTRCRAQGGTIGYLIEERARNTTVTDCVAEQNSSYGVQVILAYGTQFNKFVTRGSGSYGGRLESDCNFVQSINNDSTVGAFLVVGAITVNIINFEWGLDSVATPPFGIVSTGASIINCINGKSKVNASGGSASFYQTSTGTMTRQNVVTQGRGGYYSDAANGMLIDRMGVDDSACTVANVFGAGQQANYGTYVCNGVTGVVTNYRGMKLTSVIGISANVIGGTPSPQYLSALTAGTSFTTKGTAGDTTTYNWKDLSA